MFAQVTVWTHHALGAEEHLRQGRHVPQTDLLRPVRPRFASAEIENRSPPRFAVQLEEAARAEPRLPEQVMHVVLRPAHGAESRTALLEELRPRQRRQNRESGVA